MTLEEDSLEAWVVSELMHPGGIVEVAWASKRHLR